MADSKKHYLGIAKQILNIIKSDNFDELTRGEISEVYENLGDAYKLAGEGFSANNAYKRASNYAHDDKTKERIYLKRSERYDLSKIKVQVPKMKSLESRAIVDSAVNEKKKGFWKFAVLSISSFVFALFFISTNLTGYATSFASVNDSKWIGFCLFACGLVFAFLFLNGKKRF